MVVDEHEALIVRYNIAHILSLAEINPMYTPVVKNQISYEIK